MPRKLKDFGEKKTIHQKTNRNEYYTTTKTSSARHEGRIINRVRENPL
jgi:hypothetical protein